MKFTPLKELITYEDHVDELHRIEMSRFNYEGRWFSGYDTPMKKGAVVRVETIWLRIDRKFVNPAEAG